MIIKWDIVESFSADYPDRWKIILQGEREDAVKLANVLSKLNYSCGRPTSLREKDFNWSFYVYHLTLETMSSIQSILTDFKDNPDNFDYAKYLPPQEEKAVAPAEAAAGPLPEAVTPPPPPAAAPQVEVSEEQKAQILHELGLNSRYTFDTFVVGKNNHFAKAAALAVAEMPGKVYNPLFIYGDVGLGKTHLMQAIGHFVLGVNPSAKIIYTTAERFMAEVIDGIRYGKIIDFRNKYRKIDVLLIDDIQFLSEAEAAQEEFYHTFNALYDDHKQIVIASDKPPKKISVLEERLRSRFEWGLITDIQSPNLETRVAILKAKADITKMQIEDEVLYFIAEQLKTNIRELEGFLIRIVAYASLTKRQINKKLAEELMQDLLPEEPSGLEMATLPSLEEALVQAAEENELIPEPAPVETAPEPESDMGAEPAWEPLPESTPESAPEPAPEMPAPSEAAPLSEPTPPEPAASPAPEAVPAAPAARSGDEVRALKTGYIYPSGHDKELDIMLKNFADTIKKHKIKFKLDKTFANTYEPQPTIDHSGMIAACRSNAIDLVIWMGPPPAENIVEGEFVRNLHTAFDKEKIPLQYISFESVPKQYKYLNMVLDFAFLKK